MTFSPTSQMCIATHYGRSAYKKALLWTKVNENVHFYIANMK